MLNFVKKNLFIVLIFIITLSIGFLTFLTFIDKSFIDLNEQNLQILLVINILLLVFFFIIIFLEVKNSLREDLKIKGSKAYILQLSFNNLAVKSEYQPIFAPISNKVIFCFRYF